MWEMGGGGATVYKVGTENGSKIVNISWNWIIAFGAQRVNEDFWP